MPDVYLFPCLLLESRVISLKMMHVVVNGALRQCLIQQSTLQFKTTPQNYAEVKLKPHHINSTVKRERRQLEWIYCYYVLL